MADPRSDPWGLGVPRRRPKPSQRPKRKVRKRLQWRAVCDALGIRWRTLAYIVSVLGLPRAPLTPEGLARVRGAVALARAERVDAAGHRSALAVAVAKDSE